MSMSTSIPNQNEDLRPLVIGVNTTLILMSVLAVGCRIGRKIRVLKSFSWHDGEFIMVSSHIILTGK